MSPGASPPESPSPGDPLSSSLKKHTPLELLRPPQLLLFLRKMCVYTVVICSVLICLLSIINRNDPSLWDEHELQHLTFNLLIWGSEAFGVALISIEVLIMISIS